jgi:orotidine-5'-phosphate decarboxylase
VRIIRAVTARPPFVAQLRQAWRDQDSLLCVGLDPDPQRFPSTLPKNAGFDFCRAIVDATAEFVCAFKPQAAHFAALGQEDALARLIEHIHSQHPGIPVILDAKRGDIGSTARLYAVEAFERYGADAVTVNPYLGKESIEPYLEFADRGIVILCRTSNPGSGWLQGYPADDPTYLRVAREAARWNENGNIMLVAGATYPEDLMNIRQCVGDMPLLVPGIGAQGGDLTAVLENGCDEQGRGLVINASRAVLYASGDQDFADAAAIAARALRDDIRALQVPRTVVAAGNMSEIG